MRKIEYFSISRLKLSEGLGRLRCGIIPRPPLPNGEDFITSEYAMVYVIVGSGIYITSNGREIAFKQGSILQRFPDQRHRICWHEAGESAHLAIPNTVFTTIKNICGDIIESFPVINNCPSVDSFVETCLKVRQDLESLPENRLLTTVNLIQELFSEIILGSLFEKTTTFSLQKSVDKYLKNYLDARIKTGELATQCRMSNSTFREHFIRETGVPPGVYIIRKRLNKAAALLLENVMTIGEIAEKLGYPDIYSFSKQFKKYRGISPSEFRHKPEI